MREYYRSPLDTARPKDFKRTLYCLKLNKISVLNSRSLHLKQKLYHIFLPGCTKSCAMEFNYEAVDIHQQMSILLILLAVSPRRSGKPCQASTSWTILFTSSANLLNLQITSRKCPKSNLFWNRTKKKNQSFCSVSRERMVYVILLQTWI